MMLKKISPLVCGALLSILAGCTGSGLPDTPEIGALREGSMPTISPFGDPNGVNGEKRPYKHWGTDVAGNIGDPVLAMASGIVHAVVNVRDCGRGIVLYHPQYDLYTAYCHMSGYAELYLGDIVQRGDVIGYLGMDGDAKGVPHVHAELRSNPDLKDGSAVLDPRPFLVGCFYKKRNYRIDTGGIPLLTAPVACGSAVMETKK